MKLKTFDEYHKLVEKVEKRGDKWVALSSKGRVLGTHDTEKEANAQIAAVEISKAERGKK
ncbi:hypothetical protein KVP40.0311 [Vibrio phage KVP40]|uniref:Uncharacterized protein n=4 Tax=Schizotequatrovirus KVP40 TaxID=1914019 RepID=Q6WHJ2_BPKVM|nr:hypothetical protein KVP40.0311 [Vibrio phage KVP40]AFN37542.1 hypothetical protein pp2_309 [Vibrio phage phi-pp2]QHJ74494.1 hypothetical protein VH12019_00168 [Vibrio phage VH1_2019]QIW91102.1 hypothetical protein COHAPHLL_00265 [Vibrio phage V09]UNA01825.1 hypothetical protein [Vibrio phage PC-Liy1]URQ03122.1 hypothetical protein PVA8_136 [Vibrio phage PVA8]WBM58857.1 hypothetical protein vBValMPVA8_135 [Vibrio phage vB_ValM_PVA8]WOL24841.1 hypothetical protein [Vibrio phage PG216]